MAIEGVNVLEGVNQKTNEGGDKKTVKWRKKYEKPLINTLNPEKNEIYDYIKNLSKIEDLLNSLKKVEKEDNEETIKIKERENNDIFEKISYILFSLHKNKNGFKHIFGKDTFLNVYEKYVNYKPKSVSFPTLILNYLDVFYGLDQNVVNAILGKQNKNQAGNKGGVKEGNPISNEEGDKENLTGKKEGVEQNITGNEEEVKEDLTGKKDAKAFRANMILLHIKSFDKIDIAEVLSIFSEGFTFIKNKMFYSRYIKGETELKEKIIKDLINAWYLDDLKECYNLDKNPLEVLWITEKKLKIIAKK